MKTVNLTTKECQLLKAAPKMLSALQEILKHVQKAYRSDGREFVQELYLWDLCEEAIAEAEVES